MARDKLERGYREQCYRLCWGAKSSLSLLNLEGHIPHHSNVIPALTVWPSLILDFINKNGEKMNVDRHLNNIGIVISNNNKEISRLHDVIEIYRNVVKKDEENGKLNNPFKHAPLCRLNTLIHQFAMLKGINHDLKKERKRIVNDKKNIQYALGL